MDKSMKINFDNLQSEEYTILYVRGLHKDNFDFIKAETDRLGHRSIASYLNKLFGSIRDAKAASYESRDKVRKKSGRKAG